MKIKKSQSSFRYLKLFFQDPYFYMNYKKVLIMI